MARNKTEAAESKLKTATGLAGLGGGIGSVFSPVGGAIGAGLGGVTGLIIGDREIVFPIDMIAIPAYQAYMLNGNPSFQIFIKEGEVLNQVQLTDAQEAEATVESIVGRDTISSKKKRKRSKWNIYTSKKKNQIRFKSGKNKGLLNLKAMGRAYRKTQKNSEASKKRRSK